ncbi:MAG: OmpA family protein [Pseudonocardiaceae bacterium]
MVALAGDHYGTVEELAAAVRGPEGKAKLRAALESGGIASTATTRLPQPTPAQKEEQEKRYLELAASNVEHFAAGGRAVDGWRSHHTGALQAALTAGLANDLAGYEGAKLREAFGQHFLTDAFSGGHVRTPRGDILDWYSTTFAPRVADHLLTHIKNHMVDFLRSQAMMQIHMQARPLSGNLTWDTLREKIEPKVNEALDAAIAEAGGRAAVARMLGVVVGGAVSGAMHDLEGRRGVWVSSPAHPEPWQAFGDAQLSKSPVSEAQAQLAVLAAHAELEQAYLIGHDLHRGSTMAPPAKAHFAFGSASLTAEGENAARAAADQLKHHPDFAVDLVGHTDPIGTDADNEALGLRRAASIRAAMVAAGAPADRVGAPTSMGETAVLTRNPREYARNRRVEFLWKCVAAAGPDPVRTEAEKRLPQPPYPGVTKYVPAPVDARNPALEEWRWGQIPPAFATEVNGWVSRHVSAGMLSNVTSSPALHDVTQNGITVSPRAAVESVAAAALASPTRFLSEAFGQQISP